MSCCALTSQLKQCRNWSLLDSPLCHAHQSLTSEDLKDRWMRKYIIGPSRSPVYTVFRQAMKAKILADLREEVVVLTKKDVQTIPAREAYVDIYLLLLENKFAQYGDYPKLERCGLWLYQLLLNQFPFDNYAVWRRQPLHLLKKKIEDVLITSSGKSLFDFFMFIGMAVVGRPRLLNQMQGYIPTLLDTEAAKELSWLPRQELDKIRVEWEECAKPNRHPLMRCLVERWLLDLKELYLTEKAIQKLKMDQCKEELMMDRWHPTRLQKYLDMGYNIEQLDDIM